MSSGNIERIINKYADKIRPEYPDLPKQVYSHMFQRKLLNPWGLLSVYKIRMVQTGEKNKQNDISLLLLPFHIILPEKHGEPFLSLR